MDSRLKSKIPNTTDFKKRFKNMGQSSLNVVRYSIDNNNINTNNNKIKNNIKNKNEMPKNPTSIYSSPTTNINTNETKIKKASQTMTDFRKKK